MEIQYINSLLYGVKKGPKCCGVGNRNVAKYLKPVFPQHALFRTLTCRRPIMPQLSIRDATLTVLPHISY
jgi:hypothetical protein